MTADHWKLEAGKWASVAKRLADAGSDVLAAVTGDEEQEALFRLGEAVGDFEEAWNATR